MDLAKLREPFKANDIEWRVQRSGEKNGKPWAMVLAYVTNRAIMERLDDVCGPAGWKNYFEQGPDGGILCGIAIKCDDEWVTKWDGAANTEVEAVKGGLSGAMKRAGSQWGIGRYLYNLDTLFAIVNPKGKHSAKTKEGNWFKWDQPELPKWALPGSGGEEKPQVLTGQEEEQRQRDIEGWILVWKTAKGQNADKAVWWAEKKDGILKDCGEAGAKAVHKEVNK